ncbi:unnamed protein product [Bemisia tabaci]|uniref:Uncharacterized protein n=1 Tax=Bemisia tabaci TaxID=7038 RepID=A0A9P0G0B5_BEMTA|nr:PREDICTED: uncharacterized protein LOC109043490 [Bemisia tabaci]CAH0768910.1 unnamed protein product [Bemisia tabaci]
MRAFGIISIFVCLVCVVSINSDSAGHYKRRNGLAYGGIPYGSITGRIADFIRMQQRYPIRSFSTEDYSDDEEEIPVIVEAPAPTKKSKVKVTENNELDDDPRRTSVKFLKTSKKYTEKHRR